LTIDDLNHVRVIEENTSLAFWGEKNYRKFLLEYPEYFGCKAVVHCRDGADQIGGFLLARSVFDYLEVLKLGVVPELQRHGLGTQLMEYSYAEGQRRGCQRCFLEVRKSNLSAIQFYQLQKFRISGTRLNYYTDPVEDAYIMERQL
jgi:ribosomal-protein-alanine N-acetyltransferase